MRAVWVDEGSDASLVRLRARGIDSPYYSIRDPRVTSDYLDAVAAEGFTPGLYAAYNWYPALTGLAFAEKCHYELRRIAWLGNPPLCADIETHDVSYILAFLKRWRELRPKRRTYWTLEGFQGGLFSPADVRAINAANVHVVPQHYTGDMRPLAADRIAIDLLARGFDILRLYGFYDAAALPGRWEGFAFTQGRLP